MASTLRIDSFNEINVIERAELAADAAEGATELALHSTQGIIDGQVIYVGHLSREGIEMAAVATVSDETTVTLSEPLKLAHRAYEAVTAVLGDKTHIYRAVNVIGDALPLRSTTSVEKLCSVAGLSNESVRAGLGRLGLLGLAVSEKGGWKRGKGTA